MRDIAEEQKARKAAAFAWWLRMRRTMIPCRNRTRLDAEGQVRMRKALVTYYMRRQEAEKTGST